MHPARTGRDRADALDEYQQGLGKSGVALGLRRGDKDSVDKALRAVATGQTKMAGTVDAPIGRHPRDRIRMAVVTDGMSMVPEYE